MRLGRVREVAGQDRKARFRALLHHASLARLRAAYWAIRPHAESPTVDGVTWAEHGQNLESNLEDLHARVQSGHYRAPPSRRAYLPKADKRRRPLGIATPEDETVERAVVAFNRIQDVDALRGFALFGILLVNIWYFASGYAYHSMPDPAYHSRLDHGIHDSVALLFEMKFYLLFSFLFGYSFTLQLDVAQHRDTAFRPQFLRRLAGLFVLGVLHAVLLFHGDILTTYAVLGLVLLAVHRIRPGTAVILAGVLVVVVALFFGSMALAGEPSVEKAAALRSGESITAALAGGPGSVIAQNVRSIPHMMAGTAKLQGPVALAMFLVGLAAGRRRMLADVSIHARGLRLIQRVGYPVGLVGAFAVVALGGRTTVGGLALATLTGMALAAAYAATMLRLFHTPTGRHISAALAPAGRMALTNYLSQSLICALIFTGLGLGLIGQVPPAGVTAIALGIFSAQLVLSARWMRTHRYGPVEWILRAVTNAEWPAWRR